MRTNGHRSVMVPLIAVVIVIGCTAPSTSDTPPGSTSQAPTEAPTHAGTPVASALATPTAVPTQTPTERGLTAGTIAATVVDGLRVRSQPRVSDDSTKYEPLLPLGTQLVVLDGPVSASGYLWYEVVPLTTRPLPHGWVSSAARDGEQWLGDGRFECPPIPDDFRALAALPLGVGLACFPRVPITVEASLIPCNCDADGSWYTPSWFFLGSGSPDLLVEPGVTSVPSNLDDWFALNLDPSGQHPDVRPFGEILEVTGMFDHPAAATCTRTEMDGEPIPSQGCRLEFAVTNVLVRGP